MPSKENAERGLRSDNEEIFERPSDPVLDDLLSKILYLVDETGSWGTFDITREKEAIDAQRQYLAEYGIHTYFPKSYELLCKCE